MNSIFYRVGRLFAVALGIGACSALGTPSSQPVAGPATVPTCSPDPVVEGFVLAETIRCAWGVANPCGFAGVAYKHGLGVVRDLRRARDYFSRACDLGSQDDCVELGLMIIKLGEKARYPDVMPMWERACKEGSLAGCNAAGWGWALSAAELGIDADVGRGRSLLSRACAAGYMVSCGAEARLVAQAKDTGNYETAKASLVKACEMHERDSCHFLGQTELYGTFAPKDEAAAAGRFWEACRFGLGSSCGALAYLNAVGVGVPKDLAKARKLADILCKEMRHEAACKAAQTSDFALLAPAVP